MPLIFVPGLGTPVLAMTVMGAASGAGVGAIAGHFSDIGVDDQFAKQLGERLRPSSSAILALVKAAKVEEALPARECTRSWASSLKEPTLRTATALLGQVWSLTVPTGARRRTAAPQPGAAAAPGGRPSGGRWSSAGLRRRRSPGGG